MRIYKVGGAVRDELLGLEPTDNDWVVVGSTPKQMLSMGYKQVGKDFPVFLHPDTKEEYALARKERSTGPGHNAFNFSFSPNVTLEEDLSRRDITINAIAMDDVGNLIDPFNGKVDLENRIIRRVSNAFIEDPLRVLRVARFYAKLYQFNFEIESHTFGLLKELVSSMKHLPGERIWQETEKTLQLKNPIPYFELLYKIYDNSLVRNFLKPPPIGHRDRDQIETTFFHRFNLPKNILDPNENQLGDMRLNPGLNKPESWWAIVGKEFEERDFLDYLNERLKVPKKYKKMSELVFDFTESYFERLRLSDFYPFDRDQRIRSLYKCLEKIQPSKDPEFAIIVTFLAANNRFKNDIFEWKNFIYAYSEILPTDEEKKLDGSQIKEILKERKIRFIEEEIKKDLD